MLINTIGINLTINLFVPLFPSLEPRYYSRLCSVRLNMYWIIVV